jgi:EAL domain-containing protein (putative c-di-GMP-specific phosphodiesterase class I)
VVIRGEASASAGIGRRGAPVRGSVRRGGGVRAALTTVPSLPQQPETGAPDLVAAATGAGVRPAYQPVVELATERVVGAEALARWPGDSGLTPDVVFGAARRLDTLPELDVACRTAALAGAVGGDGLLFVNTEPGSPVPVRADAQGAGPQVVLELTERGLLDRPGQLLDQVSAARRLGWLVALDDVGVHPDSLPVLDLVRPEVIKLDLRLIQRLPVGARAQAVAAVLACVERTGATIVAEGIETAAQREQAVALGATLGQGWHFALPQQRFPQVTVDFPAQRQVAPTVPGVPSELLAELPATQTTRKAMLIGLSRHLESQAENQADPPVVLAAFQSAVRFTPQSRRRYEHLAKTSPLVAVFGADMPVDLAAGMRGASPRADDDVLNEWVVVALGPQTAAALIARDLGDRDVPDADRRFRYCLTYDRSVVVRAALSLLRRLG